MVQDLLFAAGSLGPAIANHLWQSTAFAAVVWLLTLLLRNNDARIRYALWLAASLKFLLPFSLLVVLGSLLPMPRHVAASSQPALYSAVDIAAQPFSQGALGVSEQSASLQDRLIAQLQPALALLWLCGFAAVLVVWYRRWRQVSAVLRKVVPVESGRELEILRRLEHRANVRKIPLLQSRELMEPGVFGIFRSVMLWPDRLSDQLDDEHIKAILAHETMHVRRRDNLTAELHMLVEALFWFHPLVWWMERRLIQERERACDEAVVALGNRPEAYAESLLKACRFCVESPLTCVSGITGADLSKRVRSIMTLRLEKLSRAKKVLLGMAGLAAVVVPITFGLAGVAQNHPQPQGAAANLPVFAVASIKPSKPGSDNIWLGLNPDGISTTDAPPQIILRQAFGVGDDRILGAPVWVKSDRYDIQAKVDASDVPKLKELTRDQRFSMLQPLLEDRFSLKFHHESRDLPVYVLVALGGSKMKESKPDNPDAKVGPAQHSLMLMGRGHLESHGSSMENLIYQLSFLLGRTVLDETGLTGTYDYTLMWVPDDSPPEAANAPSSETSGPSLFTALQEQLGLRLESRKSPVDVVVIDHLERPSLN